MDYWVERRYNLTSQMIDKPGSLLDVVCGPSHLQHYLKREISYIGADINLNSLKKALNRELVVADACHLPFRGSCFDYVVLAELLEHLGHQENCIQEAYRVLKSDGSLVIYTPNLLCLHSRLRVLLGKKPLWYGNSRPGGHIRLLTPVLIRALLEECGFRIIERKAFIYASICSLTSAFYTQIRHNFS